MDRDYEKTRFRKYQKEIRVDLDKLRIYPSPPTVGTNV